MKINSGNVFGCKRNDIKMEKKEIIIQELNVIIDQKIDEAKSSISAAKESRDNETKSSVGDKYETGRAMAQIELDKLYEQLEKSIKMKYVLDQIDFGKELNSIITSFG